VRDGRAMSKAPFWHKNFCLEMFEDRQTRPFETRIWSFVAPIEEDPVGSRVHVFKILELRNNRKRGEENERQRRTPTAGVLSNTKSDKWWA